MRLIDGDALKEILDKIPARSIENADGRAYVLIRLSTVFEIIKQMPSVEPERKKGGWIFATNAPSGKSCYVCSECGAKLDSRHTSYCGNCGSKMER